MWWFAVCALGPWIQAQDSAADRVSRFLERFREQDGGYCWEESPHATLAPTFYAIGAYHALHRSPPNSGALAKWVEKNHPKSQRSFVQEHRVNDYRYVQSLAWLKAPIDAEWLDIESKREPYQYPEKYESHGYPSFEGEANFLLARSILGWERVPSPYAEYIAERQRANGSYNNTPASDGSDGNVLNTYAGLRAAALFGADRLGSAALVKWLRACQLPNGGMTYQPGAEIGGVADIAYTWAAVKALELLGEKPSDVASCIQFISSLANRDGGFGDRPGWKSNPRASYYALEALRSLKGEDCLQGIEFTGTGGEEEALPAGLNVYSMQIQAHGQGSPADVVTLAGSLGIDFWGAKNASNEWLEAVRLEARSRGVPVVFFKANEGYGNWLDIPGMGRYSHLVDYILPPGESRPIGFASKETKTWQDFRRNCIQELEHRGGRLLWQFGENSALTRMLVDESLEAPGYAALSSYHFGNIDFTTSEPTLERWKGQVPFIALQDSHGPEAWWFSDMTEGMRTLFLAEEATWDGWLQALDRGWVAAVRRDSRTDGDLWVHAGNRGVREALLQSQSEWIWWGEGVNRRPMLAWAILSPDSQFEKGIPSQGLSLRIRVARRNGKQGQLLDPLAELVGVAVDGVSAGWELVEVSARKKGILADRYYRVDLSSLQAGEHKAKVFGRRLADGEDFVEPIEFSVSK